MESAREWDLSFVVNPLLLPPECEPSEIQKAAVHIERNIFAGGSGALFEMQRRTYAPVYVDYKILMKKCAVAIPIEKISEFGHSAIP